MCLTSFKVGISPPQNLLMSYSNDRRWLILCMLDNFMCFLVSVIFCIQINSKNHNECPTVWIQIRPDPMLGLICYQTTIAGYDSTEEIAPCSSLTTFNTQHCTVRLSPTF